jgi:hypothetical protein
LIDPLVCRRPETVERDDAIGLWVYTTKGTLGSKSRLARRLEHAPLPGGREKPTEKVLTTEFRNEF